MTFFLDLWHDLREKRLWPVAVGLLAAAIAIPLVMLKPAADPEPPAPITSAGPQGATLPAVNVDASPSRGSKLETFSSRNPFKPMKDLEKEDGGTGGSGGGAGGGSGDGALPGLDDLGGGGSGGSSSAGGSSSSPSGGGSSGGSGSPSTSTEPQQELRWYRYAVDVRFGPAGDQRTLREVARLSGLPSNERPTLMFMGVSDGGDRALFLVLEDGLSAAGEGKCEDGDGCRMVSLSLGGGGDEMSFFADDGGTQYDLQLLRIRREEMDAPSGAKQAQDSDDAPSAKRALSTGSATVAEAGPELLPSVLGAPDVALSGQ